MNDPHTVYLVLVSLSGILATLILCLIVACTGAAFRTSDKQSSDEDSGAPEGDHRFTKYDWRL